MEQYGDFVENIKNLEDILARVRAVWTDKTAMTYDEINKNMKVFVTQISINKESSVVGYNAVNECYDEAKFDEELNRLAQKAIAV